MANPDVIAPLRKLAPLVRYLRLPNQHRVSLARSFQQPQAWLRRDRSDVHRRGSPRVESIRTGHPIRSEFPGLGDPSTRIRAPVCMAV